MLLEDDGRGRGSAEGGRVRACRCGPPSRTIGGPHVISVTHRIALRALPNACPRGVVPARALPHFP